MNDDGTIRRELRPPEEVFKAKALDGFDGAPCTDGHPLVPVTRDNVRQYEVGSSSAGRRDGDNVLTPMTLKDAAIISKVNLARKEGRPVQLSPGYALDLEMTPGADKRYAYPGNPDGRYDAIQRNIEINHLAVLADRGVYARGGAKMKVRLDGVDHSVRAYRMDGFEVGTLVLDEELSAEQRNKLRDAQFAYPEAGKLPINDENHVRAAMGGHGFTATDFAAHPGAKKTAFHKIVAAAKAHGIDTTHFEEEYGQHLDDMVVVAVDPDESGEMEPVEPGDNNQDKRGSMPTPPTATNPTMTNADALQIVEAARINLDAKVKELSTENAALKLRADTAEGKLGEVQKQIPILQAELAQAKTASETVAVAKERTRADSAETALRELQTRRADDIRARVALERQCAPTLGAAFRMDSLSDRALMCMALKKLDAHADTADSVPEGVIIGRFQAAIERRDANASALAEVSQVMNVNRTEKARQDAQRDNKAEWQKPLPNATKYSSGG